MEAQGPDTDLPAEGNEFAQFAAGCFWGVELTFQRVHGVTKTEVGYSQGIFHNPKYEDLCTDNTKHAEVVRVQYDPNQCPYDTLLDVFWNRHDPTTINRQVFRIAEFEKLILSPPRPHTLPIQFTNPAYVVKSEIHLNDGKGNDVGTQYRSGIYYYSPEQKKAAQESMERHQKTVSAKIVTEILPAKKFYRAEEYHQQYHEKGGPFRAKQSAAKGCTDPIRCDG